MGSNNRSTDWLNQAEDDLRFAEESLPLKHYNQVCFICQQAAEKALKALAFKRGAIAIKTHSVRQLAIDLGLNGAVENAGRILDIYYISSRYPDALPGGAPFEVFSIEQAEECLEQAKIIFQKVIHDFNQK